MLVNFIRFYYKLMLYKTVVKLLKVDSILFASNTLIVHYNFFGHFQLHFLL